MNNRRTFLKKSALMTMGLGIPYTSYLSSMVQPAHTDQNANQGDSLFFQISLAEWSLHRALQSGKMQNLDFPLVAKREFGIEHVEYVNQFFKDKAKDKSYLSQLKRICDDNGIKSVLIMCDGEGNMGDASKTKRLQAVENHYQWVEAAKALGCHSIRVNAYGEGKSREVAKWAADSLRRLTTFADDYGIGIIVENHGSYSSNGQWLSGVIRSVNKPGCGTLPDFGNFCVRWKGAAYGECAEYYDRYLGVSEMMPYAKGVSAKSYAFDANGDCVETDYYRMLKIVKAAGYTGCIGIEYEGSGDEYEGIRKTMALLKKAGAAV